MFIKILMILVILFFCIIGIFQLHRRKNEHRTGSFGNALLSFHETIEPSMKSRKEIVREIDNEDDTGKMKD